MIGKEIKRIRQKKGYSISKLAKMADVSKSYLSQIERGLQTNPSLQFLMKISKPLDTNFENLFVENKHITGIGDDLDEEWKLLITQAINAGMSKDDFIKYLNFIEYQNWLDKDEE
ncbi:helix-turn-helix domain-containing protein [Peribacillus deserti]|uniref:Transcriptional regulator n=1 Tax=Peribacillus deserti TaxID=673318 RepID=A0A2N5M5S4_9BACI|nr:helix-turn-helix domain-containing protein [Peribacillus deserti]PLT29695.1 transcriptional regulator [Peribacillus deserti]